MTRRQHGRWEREGEGWGNSKVMAWRMETWSSEGRNQRAEEEGARAARGWRRSQRGRDASAEEGPAQLQGPSS